MQRQLQLYETVTPFERFLITVVVMSASLMQVIDTTIVNVALPHMQGSLGTSSDEITWTLTSYLVSSAICMPLTGYFSDRLGRRRFLLISIAGFTFTSVLCGASETLTQIVFFRLLQGVFGAGLVPLSQAILTDIYPPEDRGKAMAIWGTGIMVGPILGPTLGGYLTDVLTWRWTFYVNLPVGLFTLMFINSIPDSERAPRRMDWLGLTLLSLAIGGLQYVLDRGNTLDWFSSTEINIVAYITVTAMLGFIWHSRIHQSRSVFNLVIFKDRNFAIATIVLAMFCLGMYGVMVIQPILMETLYNYSALTTGLVMAPRGITGMISMIIAGKLVNRIDPRWMMLFGILLSVIGMYICTYYSVDNINPYWLVVPLLLQGAGMGFIMVPLSTIAFATLAPRLRTEAAGLYSLLRTLGGSIGISIAITLITRGSQYFWQDLGGKITAYSLQTHAYLSPLGLHPQQPMGAALLGQMLSRQAAMLSYINAFAIMMWCFVAMVPLIFLFKQAKKS